MSGAYTLGSQIRIDLGWVTGCHMAYQRGIDQDAGRAAYTTIKSVNFMLSPVAAPTMFAA